MSRNERTGEGEEFEDYFDGDVEVVIEGEHRDVRYKIYRIPRATREELKDGHYTGYICLEDMVEDASDVYIDELPPSPGHHRINFGPTTDGWIGFGTIDGRDYNYYSNMVPLEADSRMDEEGLVGDDEIYHFTPEILRSSIMEWIEDLHEELNGREFEYPDPPEPEVEET